MLPENMGQKRPKSKSKASFDFADLIRLPLPDPHSCISEDACAQERAKVLFRTIPLTRGWFALVDADDYPQVSIYRWFYQPAYAPTYTGYAGRRAGLVDYRLHRVIAACPAGKITDHINGDGLDNRKCNLRNCSYSENRANSRVLSPRTRNRHKPYIGVTRRSRTKTWVATIKGKRIGIFKTSKEAALAYDRAAIDAYGEFLHPSQLNFPNA